MSERNRGRFFFFLLIFYFFLTFPNSSLFVVTSESNTKGVQIRFGFLIITTPFKPLEVLPLSGATIQSGDDPRHFEVEGPNYSIGFEASSSKERLEWIKILTKNPIKPQIINIGRFSKRKLLPLFSINVRNSKIKDNQIYLIFHSQNTKKINGIENKKTHQIDQQQNNQK